MAVLGPRLCVRALSSCSKQGPLFITVRGPLTIAASLVAEHRLQTRRLSNFGSQAQPLCGMWDPHRPGLEPVSPALAGRLSTTAPPGKPPYGLTYHLKLMFPYLFSFSMICPLVNVGYQCPPLLLCYCQFLLLWLLAFALCIEVLLCWVHKYLQLLYLLIGLIP